MSCTTALERPTYHVYALRTILCVLQMYLIGAISFRACSAIAEILGGHWPQPGRVPAANTVQSWLLRLGLYELERPKPQAEDWAIMLDHTSQLGAQKCLVILGIRLSDWHKLRRPLALQDMTVLMLRPVTGSDGSQVCEQLHEVEQAIGTPKAILSDQGSDIVSGAKQFRETHPKTLLRKDIAHAAAHVLKDALLADPKWPEFLKHCGQTQPKVKQTELGALAPPPLKVKGRYMNVGSLISWGQRMLSLINTPPERRPVADQLAKLDEKFGWIRQFGPLLAEWAELHAIKEETLSYIRLAGYHGQAAEQLQQRLAVYQEYPSSRLMAQSIVELVREQSQDLEGLSLPGSTEVIESIIGKGKRMQAQHSRNGFTKMLLAMAACVVILNEQRIREALEQVKESTLRRWIKKTLGTTLTSFRRAALPAGNKKHINCPP